MKERLDSGSVMLLIILLKLTPSPRLRKAMLRRPENLTRMVIILLRKIESRMDARNPAEAKTDLGEEAAVQIPGMVKRQSERGKGTEKRTRIGLQMIERKTGIVIVTGAEIDTGKGREIKKEIVIEMVARIGIATEIGQEIRREREIGTECLEGQPGAEIENGTGGKKILK
jgi:hypothetical protein